MADKFVSITKRKVKSSKAVEVAMEDKNPKSMRAKRQRNVASSSSSSSSSSSNSSIDPAILQQVDSRMIGDIFIDQAHRKNCLAVLNRLDFDQLRTRPNFFRAPHSQSTDKALISKVGKPEVRSFESIADSLAHVFVGHIHADKTNAAAKVAFVSKRLNGLLLAAIHQLSPLPSVQDFVSLDFASYKELRTRPIDGDLFTDVLWKSKCLHVLYNFNFDALHKEEDAASSAASSSSVDSSSPAEIRGKTDMSLRRFIRFCDSFEIIATRLGRKYSAQSVVDRIKFLMKRAVAEYPVPSKDAVLVLKQKDEAPTQESTQAVPSKKRSRVAKSEE